MKRFVELMKMLVYVMVTIVVYMGVNQFMLVVDSYEILHQDWKITEWVEDIWEVKAGNKDEVYVSVIDEYLLQKDSPMTGSGAKFVQVAREYDLPIYLMVAMTGAESSFGKVGYAKGTYNAVGLGVHEGRKYNNWGEGIEDMGFVLRNYYFDEGKDTTIAIQNKWAPRCVDGNACSNSWAQNVDYFINEMQILESNKGGE